MKKILSIALIFISAVTMSQQEPMFTHYSFNTSIVNPAYAGHRGVLSASVFNRSQWAGFIGAPVTQNVNVHMPFASNKLGVGINMIHDRLGPTRTVGVVADLAARIKMGKRGKLAVGLKVGSSFRSNDLGALSTHQANDPNFSQNIQTEVLPNIGWGVYYSNPKFYAGASMPRVLTNQIDGLNAGTSGNDNIYERHYYFIAGGIFNLTKDGKFKLRPSTFFKLTKGVRPQLDLTALVYIQDKYWVGPMFRMYDSFGVLAGMQVTDQIAVGYSFDWSYGMNTVRYNSGSHEFMLRYEFIFKKRGGIDSPRYF